MFRINVSKANIILARSSSFHITSPKRRCVSSTRTAFQLLLLLRRLLLLLRRRRPPEGDSRRTLLSLARAATETRRSFDCERQTTASRNSKISPPPPLASLSQPTSQPECKVVQSPRSGVVFFFLFPLSLQSLISQLASFCFRHGFASSLANQDDLWWLTKCHISSRIESGLTKSSQLAVIFFLLSSFA